MNFNKKTVLAAAAITTFGVASIALPMGVAAQEAEAEDTTFSNELAQRLGVETEQVDTAIEDIRSERKAERQAQIEANLSEALANGTITQDEYDLATALREIRENSDFEKPDRSEFENLTSEERQELKEQFRSERTAAVIETLSSDYDIDVTEDDLESLKEKLQEFNILPEKGERGIRGFRR